MTHHAALHHRRTGAFVGVVAAVIGLLGAPAVGAEHRALGASNTSLIGQKLMVAMSGATPSPSLLGRVSRGEIGGVVLFADNLTTPASLAGLSAKLQAVAAAGGQPRVGRSRARTPSGSWWSAPPAILVSTWTPSCASTHRSDVNLGSRVRVTSERGVAAWASSSAKRSESHHHGHADRAGARPSPVSSDAWAVYVSRSSRTGSGVFGCAAGEYDG